MRDYVKKYATEDYLKQYDLTSEFEESKFEENKVQTHPTSIKNGVINTKDEDASELSETSQVDIDQEED